MSETRELRSVVDAAEQAAAAGDYEAAEEHLREAARLQEDHLGPLHPDLANTLNNLGVVSEMRNKPADAEQFFRRACAIATTALEPDHPFVATSRKNLEDFCKAQGIAVDLPAAPPVAPPEETPPTDSVELQPERASVDEPQPVESRRRLQPLEIALIAGGMLVIAMLAAQWFRSGDESSPESPAASPPGGAASTPAPSPVAPVPAPRKAPDDGRDPGAPETGDKAGPPPLVVEARLCRDLSFGGPDDAAGTWQCVPAGIPASPGLLYFYTRLKSTVDQTVEHRWYSGNRLRQVMELQLRANTTGGYRTYSRRTVDNKLGGDWRVELRTRDGTLLQQVRFAVQ
jgi:hypothetical protein